MADESLERGILPDDVEVPRTRVKQKIEGPIAEDLRRDVTAGTRCELDRRRFHEWDGRGLNIFRLSDFVRRSAGRCRASLKETGRSDAKPEMSGGSCAYQRMQGGKLF